MWGCRAWEYLYEVIGHGGGGVLCVGVWSMGVLFYGVMGHGGGVGGVCVGIWGMGGLLYGAMGHGGGLYMCIRGARGRHLRGYMGHGGMCVGL